ncbi:hypothetical protein JHK85_022371 [Glycine max]|nr:hypothetical protein JHK85_022371 [Glycine max]
MEFAMPPHEALNAFLHDQANNSEKLIVEVMLPHSIPNSPSPQGFLTGDKIRITYSCNLSFTSSILEQSTTKLVICLHKGTRHILKLLAKEQSNKYSINQYSCHISLIASILERAHPLLEPMNSGSDQDEGELALTKKIMAAMTTTMMEQETPMMAVREARGRNKK